MQNLGGRDISQSGRFGDTSDGITMFQHRKIMTGLFRISYYYLRRSALVKSDWTTEIDDTGRLPRVFRNVIVAKISPACQTSAAMRE